MHRSNDTIHTVVRSFSAAGAYAIVDGQYGSTGKGLIASFLARHVRSFDWNITNAGPNSGHTSYFGGAKIVLKQLPTFAVTKWLMGEKQDVVLSAGAMINKDILKAEMQAYPPHDSVVCVNPRAGLISARDMQEETKGSISNTATTGQGGGANLSRKVRRDPLAVAGYFAPSRVLCPVPINMERGERVLLEVSQGFSLGLNQRFYPKVTSRECTVAQAFSDAGISPLHFVGCLMTLRTFPIRVGNVGDISSGDWYPDQEEIKWADIGVQPELTTVTKRERRIATFSWMQFRDACRANTPTIIFLNFCNYLSEAEASAMIEGIRHEAEKILGFIPIMILGHGPNVEDCEVV